VANELILIVEDDPKNLKLVRDTLQFKGYRTIDARTGDQQPSAVVLKTELGYPRMLGASSVLLVAAQPPFREAAARGAGLAATGRSGRWTLMKAAAIVL
jgi:hypothetical protein